MSYRTTFATYPSLANDDFLLKGLDPGPVETFSPGTSAHVPSRVQLRNVKPIASYSWVDGTTPSIAVPGYPRIWKNTTVTTVPADSGIHYVNHNALRMGHHSLFIPIFAAIDSLNDDFQYRDVDLITDRSNLRKLLRCVDQQHHKTFRIDLDLLGNACLLTCCEEAWVVTIDKFCGYGHEYELAATKPRRGSEDNISHHCIITYDFGGIKVLLRYEVDACVELESEHDYLFASSAMSVETRETSAFPDDSAYSSQFGMKIKLTSPRSVLPQSSVIEIKTRSARRELDWKEVYPQLYLSQTPYLYLAKHTRGTFGPVEKVQINSQGMIAHTREAEATMAKLEALLNAILKAVRKHGEGVPLTLVYRAGKLQLYTRKAGTGQSFGKDILSKFQRAAPT
ncbi:hypothetical protein F5J12DRAFT_727783 [Pisolithus orientalis]|uniref:uncharacterized protein n=1 Tax=Pisolithus orientalis TaxID=936130 RepID=UPI002225039E|nr:uncharacterized protein F5J12DRAFT_727783 [Pisolithus orientalis]KAI5989813.1 hypothetical protein F5J12DRAFT_727783 [Pisolithus orientalis]